jgi:hypothetical protein
VGPADRRVNDLAGAHHAPDDVGAGHRTHSSHTAASAAGLATSQAQWKRLTGYVFFTGGRRPCGRCAGGGAAG